MQALRNEFVSQRIGTPGHTHCQLFERANLYLALGHSHSDRVSNKALQADQNETLSFNDSKRSFARRHIEGRFGPGFVVSMVADDFVTHMLFVEHVVEVTLCGNASLETVVD